MEEAREPAGASDEVVVVAGWVAVASVWEENAPAPIAAIGQLTKEVLPAMR